MALLRCCTHPSRGDPHVAALPSPPSFPFCHDLNRRRHPPFLPRHHRRRHPPSLPQPHRRRRPPLTLSRHGLLAAARSLPLRPPSAFPTDAIAPVAARRFRRHDRRVAATPPVDATAPTPPALPSAATAPSPPALPAAATAPSPPDLPAAATAPSLPALLAATTTSSPPIPPTAALALSLPANTSDSRCRNCPSLPHFPPTQLRRCRWCFPPPRLRRHYPPSPPTRLPRRHNLLSLAADRSAINWHSFVGSIRQVLKDALVPTSNVLDVLLHRPQALPSNTPNHPGDPPRVPPPLGPPPYEPDLGAAATAEL
ncbi:unnamed protein product [Closterium sp. NIES-64]|nr:unnamed protein product [Closterium sp. NIES-64]